MIKRGDSDTLDSSRTLLFPSFQNDRGIENEIRPQSVATRKLESRGPGDTGVGWRHAISVYRHTFSLMIRPTHSNIPFSSTAWFTVKNRQLDSRSSLVAANRKARESLSDVQSLSAGRVAMAEPLSTPRVPFTAATRRNHERGSRFHVCVVFNPRFTPRRLRAWFNYQARLVRPTVDSCTH